MLVPAKLELLPEIMRCKRCSHVLSMHKVFVDSEDISYQHAKCHYKKCRRDGPLLLQWGMKKQVTVVGKYRTSSTYPDIRTGRKTPPLWVVINISRGLGTENQRDYGNAIVESFAAADMPMWHYHVVPFWPTMRHIILKRDDKKCVECGLESRNSEADHIIPKAVNPDPFWDESNLRVLCVGCHHKKTASDVRSIAIRKKSAKYRTLSSFQQVNERQDCKMVDNMRRFRIPAKLFCCLQISVMVIWQCYISV